MKKFFRILMFVILGVIVLGTFVFLYQKSKPKVIVYEIVSPTKHTITKKTVATGKVEPRDEILIKPQINGIIAELYKEAGHKVQANEVIAKVKVVPDMNSLNSAESRVNLSEIEFKQNEINYKRVSDLFEKGVVSREDYEQTEMSYNRSKEELQAANDALGIIKTGISSRSAGYSTTMVTSTVSGLVLAVPVKVGTSVVQSNNFNDGTTIASVANLSDMLFIGKIDETEIGKIHTGAKMTLTIGALRDVKLTAILEQIAPKGVEENGAILFEMKAAVKIPDSIFIRAGYSANAEIITDNRDSVWAIPESCVEFSKDTAFVQILTKEKPQEFTKQIVTLGLSDGINIEILDGLDETDRIRGAVVDNKKKTPKK
ncbi:RND transporter MFP subunit [Bacteroidia bacterium]|nr:RND transporter MFP subunit [Bacteroidia bacterium]